MSPRTAGSKRVVTRAVGVEQGVRRGVREFASGDETAQEHEARHGIAECVVPAEIGHESVALRLATARHGQGGEGMRVRFRKRCLEERKRVHPRAETVAGEGADFYTHLTLPTLYSE